MNTQHTQGKWEATEKGYIVLSDIRPVCNVFDFNELALKAEAKANARLIAAAPEMLQMIYCLKKCIERLTSDDALTQYDKDTEAQWIGEAHELLNKVAPGYYNNANETL